jgi:glycosyltransferase involved in cell wall biosynthesis
MKVLLLSAANSRNAGGLYNSVRNLGQELYKQGVVSPSVLAFHDEFSTKDLGAYAPLPVEEYNIIGPPGIGFSFDLNNKIKQAKPDVIHVQGIYLYSSHVNRMYSKKNSVPYTISPRGMLDKWILNTNPLKKKIGFFLYESDHLKNAKCIHALGTSEHNSIRNFGLKNPISVIPNGVFLPSEKAALQTVPEWKQDNRKVILFLSRLHPKKGIENLMKAWTLLGNEKENWKVVIAGESNGPDYLESLIALKDKLKLEKDIFFIGPKFHQEKDNTFRNVNAFILPSFSEGMPMAVLEAWSYKLPALITEECNLPEGFSKNAAIKIETDPDGIANGLKKLFALSDEERNQIGNSGYNLVKEKYTWSSIVSEMTHVYNWMLDDSVPVPSSIQFY